MVKLPTKESEFLKPSLLVFMAALMLSLVLLAGCSEQQPSLTSSLTPDQDVGYSLYYGLIDKDTKEQEKSTEEYKQVISDIFLEEGIGFTVYEANGAYPLEDGTVVENVTLVFTGIHGTDEAISELIEKTQKELNIESVYCESTLRGYGIYGGVVNTFES